MLGHVRDVGDRAVGREPPLVEGALHTVVDHSGGEKTSAQWAETWMQVVEWLDLLSSDAEVGAHMQAVGVLDDRLALSGPPQHEGPPQTSHLDRLIALQSVTRGQDGNHLARGRSLLLFSLPAGLMRGRDHTKCWPQPEGKWRVCAGRAPAGSPHPPPQLCPRTRHSSRETFAQSG